MAIRTELSLRVPNTPGALGRVCALLSDTRVNLIALHLESSGRLRLLVDNPLHAAQSLRDADHEVEERDVLYTTLSNTSGALAQFARGLGNAGVNVEYAYAGAVEGSPTAAVVIGVADAQDAAMAAGV